LLCCASAGSTPKVRRQLFFGDAQERARQSTLLDVDAAGRKANALAKALRATLAGESGVLEGARLVSGLWSEHPITETPIAHEDPDLSVVSGIASEGDRFPLPHARQYLEPEALANLDAELQAFEDHYRARFLVACGNLLEKLSGS
jgi:hypothetical protein